MTTGGPAGAVTNQAAMVDVADIKRGSGIRPPYLRMTTEAEVCIAKGQHLGVDRAVRIVATGASFAKRGVLKNEGPGLLSMALRTGFVPSRHGQTARRLHDVHPMGVVALGAIHFAFGHGMMLGQVELGVDIEMTLKAGLRIFARVDDEFFASRSADGHMLAGWAVARFASVLPCGSGLCEMEPGVRTGGEGPGNFRVAIHARFIPDESRALDHGRCNDGSFDGGAGIEEQEESAQAAA
jgi:hypothetical protein